MALVSRDPFARNDLHRRRVYNTLATCSFCGCHNSTPKGRRYLYLYTTKTDGGSEFSHSGMFCTRACFNAYHGN